MAEEKKEQLTPEQEYMKEKSAILAEMSEVFKKHNCDPNLSIEILAEMLMQIFVGMQWMTDEKMEHYVFPFLGKPIGNPFVVSTKCLTGHECWMSGVSQVVYALIQMQGAFVAPHINLEQPEPAAARLNIPTKPTVTNINHVLCNAFGFGGTNSSIIISKP